MISKYFSEHELFGSKIAERRGIDNRVPDSDQELLFSLYETARKMDKVREILDAPILVSSWYRCLELNRLLKSKDTSAHIRGKAVDFTCPEFGSPRDIVIHLARFAHKLQFDQLIYERSWVHISFSDSAGKPRGEVLTLEVNGTYSKGVN